MEFNDVKKILNDMSNLQIMDITGYVLGYYGSSDPKTKLVIDIDKLEDLNVYEIYPVNNYTLGIQIDYDYNKKMNKIDDVMFEYKDDIDELYDELYYSADATKEELKSYFENWSIEKYPEDFIQTILSKFKD